MKIGTPKEVFDGEARVAMTPDSARQLQKLGYECVIESGAGDLAGFSDKAYEAAGVSVRLIGGADEARELDAQRAIDQAVRLAAAA